jgi:subtilase family serine protease
VIYPSASPNVISVGGTSTARSLLTGNLIAEIAWSDTGGGVSYYEPSPSYQSALSAINFGYRTTPDISAVANPNTGVWVYDSFPYGGIYYSSSWWTVGGTSVAAPIVTGIVNAASAKSGVWATSTGAELTTIYSAGSFSGVGYDLCIGVGSPKGLAGK